MADANPNPTATPPAASGGLSIDQVNAAVAAALKPITDTLKSLGDNQKILGDTLAALPPAKAEDKKQADRPAGLTLDAVQKLLDDRDKAASAKTQREQLVSQLVKDKLGGNAALAAALTGETPEQLAASADKLAASLKPATPANVGGAATGGGTPPAAQPIDTSKLSPTQLIAAGLRSRSSAAPVNA
jgi:hypothetical protein